MWRKLAVIVSTIVVGAAATNAQTTRLTTSREALPQAPHHPIQLLGINRALAAFDGGAWVFDTTTLGVMRKHDAAVSVELLPSTTRRLRPVLTAKNQDGGHSVIDTETGATVLRIDAREELLLVTETGRGMLALSHNGAMGDQSGVGEPHRLFARLSGRDKPVATLDLGHDRSGQPSPRIAISFDGATIGLVHNKKLRLADTTTGNVDTIDVPGEHKLIHLAFAPIGNRVVLLTEKGPLIELDLLTRKIMRRIPAPDLPRRWEIVVHGRGDVISIEGRRQRAIIDAASGNSVDAARGGSGSGYILDYVAPDLVLRAAKGRLAKQATYGFYKRQSGGFRLLYKHDLIGLSLSTLAVSPNGKCLFLATKQRGVFRDVASHREIGTLALSAGFDNLRFADDGRAILGINTDNQLTAISAPNACRTVTAAGR